MTNSLKRMTVVAALAAGIGIFGAAQTAHAAAITWTGAIDNFWDGFANWDGFQVPGQFDDASINAGTPLSALFGTSAHIIGSLNVSGALHLRNNSYIRLLQASGNHLNGGEIRLFEAAIIDATNTRSQITVDGNGLLDIRDNAQFNNAARLSGGAGGSMIVGSTLSSETNNRLNISGAGRFNNSGRVRLRHATMNVSGQGVIYNAPSSNFRQEHNGAVVNLQDLAHFENVATYSKSGGTLNIGGNSSFRNVSSAGLVQFLNARGDTNISGNGFFDNDGIVSLSGGSINLSGAGVMTTSSLYRQVGGALNIQNGALFVNEAGAQTATLNGGTFRVHAGGRATNNANQFVTGGMLNNGASVIVDGAGVLDGVGTFVQDSGSTTINGLMVQTGVIIRGGTLGGTGRIRSDVFNSGTVGPGNSPGTLTVEGDFVQRNSGRLAIEIDSLSAFDILAIEGAATLGGVLDLTVDAGYAATAQEGDLFTIIEWTSYSGAFAAVTGLSFGDGLFFTLDYGAAGLTLLVNAEQIAEVSEPGMILMFCIALAGMGTVRRRHQRP
jgi:hypothetical protein